MKQNSALTRGRSFFASNQQNPTDTLCGITVKESTAPRRDQFSLRTLEDCSSPSRKGAFGRPVAPGKSFRNTIRCLIKNVSEPAAVFGVSLTLLQPFFKGPAAAATEDNRICFLK